MRILLDSHCWLWSLAQPDRLAEDALASMRDGRNEVFLSAASVWEIAIKISLGKLTIFGPLTSFVPTRLAQQGLTSLPVTDRHAAHVTSLPHLHRDPFDRLLVAQAQIEGLALMTVDPEIARYDVELLWAARGASPR